MGESGSVAFQLNFLWLTSDEFNDFNESCQSLKIEQLPEMLCILQ